MTSVVFKSLVRGGLGHPFCPAARTLLRTNLPCSGILIPQRSVSPGTGVAPETCSASLHPGLLLVFLSGAGASSPNSEQGLATDRSLLAPSPGLSVTG
ncbi:hypothetical protein FA13DRAFT_53029 [Coprinellus micaceus]|uniref:Uncharacterized protein n=1 Tax=Coprinellus micaceus TaxID=71717 RepID=A0A4Y7U0X4_COPMI|nr:hypothetical protein FA13DRAFT_53029 [Coprinellus micaceus]